MAETRFADLNSSRGFERGWNILQTAIEIFVFLVVIAGLAGLFGSGPLSSRTERFQTAPVEMTFERIQRRTVQSQLLLKTSTPLGRHTLDVEIPNEMTAVIDVVSTLPRPVSMRAEAGGTVYVFALGPAQLGTIAFSLKPRQSGLIRSVVKVGDAQAPLNILVLP